MDATVLTTPAAPALAGLIAAAERYLQYLDGSDMPELYFVDMPDVNEAVVNHLFNDPRRLHFNAAFFNGMDPLYAQLVALHEIYHTVRQGLKRHDFVVDLRDRKLWDLMQFSDVEADAAVAAYLKETDAIASFQHYVAVLHQGASTYRDAQTRIVKLERFIGSLVSIKQVFNYGRNIVHMPFIGCESIAVVSVDYTSAHLHFEWLPLDLDEVNRWRSVYQKAGSLNRCEYCIEITHLTNRFLNTLKNTQR